MARVQRSKRHSLRTVLAALAAITAALGLLGSMAGAAAAAPAPPTPVVSAAAVHYSKNHAYITLTTTPCAGCRLVAAARYGAHAAFPTSVHGSGVQRLVVLAGTHVEMLRDLTTYRLSIWQRKAGVDSVQPAHVTVTAPEDFFQLQTTVDVSARGPHSLTVSYGLLGANITGDLARLALYVTPGRTPPGSAHLPPDGRPAWSCTMPNCPHATYPDVVAKGLVTHRHYSVLLYGFDHHGHVRRGTGYGFVVGLGTYVGMHELPGGQSTTAGSLAVDRSGGEHELVAQLDDPSTGLSYLTRRPGHMQFADQPVRGAGHPDTLFLASSVDGQWIDVVTATCRAVDVIAVPATADRLPAITPHDKVLPQHRCGNGGDGTDAHPDLQSVVALPSGRVALLLDNDPRSGAADPVQTVYLGRPGHHFVRTVLPGSTSKVLGAVMTRDPVTGALYVANTAGDNVDVWTLARSKRSWSKPVVATALRSDGSQILSSIAALDSELWIGVFREADINDGFSRPTPATDGAYLVHRSRAGHWSRLSRLPHSGRLAQGILLATSPDGSAVWELDSLVSRHGGNAASGLERRQLRPGHGWSTPTRLTHWYYDDPLGLVASWQDTAIAVHELF
jgi:hypothetical protein